MEKINFIAKNGYREIVIDLIERKTVYLKRPSMTNDKHSVSVCVFQGVHCSAESRQWELCVGT